MIDVDNPIFDPVWIGLRFVHKSHTYCVTGCTGTHVQLERLGDRFNTPLDLFVRGTLKPVKTK